ncbi:hypothetical protein HGRIS_010590 [Hohenbuehelia grisea]|uniref:Uncharacterized protein n=1 Tax=Hohenbuehelia grisea TaxID=104357 RepID=A0ABR3IXJ4_9AGAR
MSMYQVYDTSPSRPSVTLSSRRSSLYASPSSVTRYMRSRQKWIANRIRQHSGETRLQLESLALVPRAIEQLSKAHSLANPVVHPHFHYPASPTPQTVPLGILAVFRPASAFVPGSQSFQVPPNATSHAAMSDRS